MDFERIKNLKNNILSCVESQMHNLEEVDTKELGEAIDMIKDLAEVCYYESIVKAMEESGKDKPYQERMYYQEMMPYPGSYAMYSPGRNGNGNGNNNGNGNGNWERRNGSSSSNESYPQRDYREGRSSMNRRKYMESKEHNSDKSALMRELEQYAQELTQDIVEMIEDASSEEKQYLEKKLVTLASKVGQMK